MAKPRERSAREKILEAAVEVARSEGAGNLSLDAVAARAGVSKGGLLYHFPSKASLLRALVETFIAEFEQRMADTRPGESVLARYVDLTLEECQEVKSDGAGIMAAMAEDPDFLKPIKPLKRRLLDQLASGAANKPQMLVVFLALEGLRSQRLFDLDVLTPEETASVTETLLAMAR